MDPEQNKIQPVPSSLAQNAGFLLIDELESRDLVTRVINQMDRRSNTRFITPRGKKTLTQAERLLVKQQEMLRAHVRIH